MNYWRSAYEFYASLGWLFAALSSLYVMYVSDLPIGPFIYILIISLYFIVRRLYAGIEVWRHRDSLRGKSIEWVDTAYIQKKMDKKPGYLWLGWGFDWKREHMQKLYDLEKFEIKDLLLRWPFKNEINPKKGIAALHGVEPYEKDVYVPLKDIEGHVFVPATTGAIKTRLLALMAVQAIRRKPYETVIIFDPKGDSELKDLVKRECEKAGRGGDFAYFHPAFPTDSVRIDVLRNQKRYTEIASRIAALIPSESGNDPFSAFGWRVVSNIAEGSLLGLEERPTLKSIRKYVEGGPDELVRKTIVRVLESQDINWRREIEPYLKKIKVKEKPSATTPDETMALVMYYKEERSTVNPHSLIDGLISMFEHNREHLGKMIASLIPILTMLTAGDLSDLLSPDRNDINDKRAILDGAKIIESSSVVYVGLDSLSDSVVGDAIGSIMLADLTSAAGSRYNNSIFEPKINLFVDEANQVTNAPLIQLLNKSRGAGFRVVFFTQTINDFITKLGDEASARMVLGNANNVVAGRIKDKTTSDYVMETFGRTILTTTQETSMTSSPAESSDVMNFSTSYGGRTTETLSEIVPPESIGGLPDLEYFAEFSGNRIVKGRIPLIDI